jgi:hypothetical protein
MGVAQFGQQVGPSYEEAMLAKAWGGHYLNGTISARGTSSLGDGNGNAIPGTGIPWHWSISVNQLENRFSSGWSDFQDGWNNKGSSFNSTAPSSIAYVSGVMVSAIGYSVSAELYRTTKLVDRVPMNSSLKAIGVAGKVVGGAGAAFTAYENYYDADGFTAGDTFKVALALGMALTPVGAVGAGLIVLYSVADIGVGLYTGVSITDRIGAGIDSTLGENNFHLGK